VSADRLGVVESDFPNGTVPLATPGHSSIRENLLFGNPDASDTDTIQAARNAQTHDRIMEFDSGYDTVVGGRGYRLSGGEKQRIAIARALLHYSRVLIFEVVTSALDTACERQVKTALDRLMATRTTLAIAHCLATIILFDVFYVLDR
jgi:ATP-binding cassette subfamily B protein